MLQYFYPKKNGKTVKRRCTHVRYKPFLIKLKYYSLNKLTFSIVFGSQYVTLRATF